MSKKDNPQEDIAASKENESARLDKELLELITRNESFKEGITKLVQQIDKINHKEQNQ